LLARQRTGQSRKRGARSRSSNDSRWCRERGRATARRSATLLRGGLARQRTPRGLRATAHHIPADERYRGHFRRKGAQQSRKASCSLESSKFTTARTRWKTLDCCSRYGETAARRGYPTAESVTPITATEKAEARTE